MATPGAPPREHEERQDEEGRLKADLLLLARASLELSAIGSTDAVASGLARVLAPVPFDHASVVLVGEDGVARTAASAPSEAPPPLGEHGPLLVLRTGTPELTDTLGPDPYLSRLRRAGHARALTVPIATSGKVLGTLTVAHGSEGEVLTAERIPLLAALAQRAALALELSRMTSTLLKARAHERRISMRASRMLDLSTALTEAASIEDVADALVRGGPDAVGARSVLVYALEQGEGWLQLLRSTGVEAKELASLRRIPGDARTPAAEAVRHRRAVWQGESASLQTAALPLMAGRRVAGVVSLDFDHKLDDEERESVLFLARQSAPALDRARLLHAEREARAAADAGERRLSVLSGATALMGTLLGAEATLSAVARLAVPELADWCMVYLPDGSGGLKTLAAAHVDGHKVARLMEIERRWPIQDNAAQGPGFVLRTGLPELRAQLTPERLAAIARDGEHLRMLTELGFRSSLAVPLVARGRTLGVLRFATAESERRYGPADVSLAEELARRAALALDNARLFEAERAARAAAEAAAARTTRLQEITAALSEVNNVEEAAGITLDSACRALDARGGVLLLTDRQGDTLIPVRFWGFGDENALPTLRLSVAEHRPLSVALRERSPVWLESPEALAARFPGVHVLSPVDSPGAVVCFPLLAEHVRGVLGLYFVGPRPASDEDRDLLLAITRQCAQALQRIHLLEETQNAARAREELLAVVSHDLRNPLATVRMSAQQMLRILTPGSDERLHRAAEMIVRSADRTGRLLQDLLDFSYVEAGRLSVRLEEIEVAALLSDAREAMAPLAVEAGLTLAMDPPPALRIFADRDRVLQVLSNLLGNALKYTPAGGTVRLSSLAKDNDLVMNVADSGPGISADDLPHVFDRYWQARNSGRAGAGLGLFISRGIVEAHGGRLWVESEAGQGSVFSFSIPRIRS